MPIKHYQPKSRSRKGKSSYTGSKDPGGPTKMSGKPIRIKKSSSSAKPKATAKAKAPAKAKTTTTAKKAKTTGGALGRYRGRTRATAQALKNYGK